MPLGDSDAYRLGQRIEPILLELDRRSRTGPGRSSSSTAAATKKHPPSSPLFLGHDNQFSKSERTRGSPRGAVKAGLTTASTKLVAAYPSPKAAVVLSTESERKARSWKGSDRQRGAQSSALRGPFRGQAGRALDDRLPGDFALSHLGMDNSTNVRICKWALAGLGGER